METKICTKCGEKKILDYFTPDSRKKDGHTSICKACCKVLRRSYFKEYHIANKEKKRKATKEWIANNKERAKAYKKEYWQKEEVKEKARIRSNNYYQKSEFRKEYLKKYYKTNIYRKREVSRLSAKKNYPNTLIRIQADISNLNTSYIKVRLRKQYGIYASKVTVPPEIIELKRFELKTKRYVKQNRL